MVMEPLAQLTYVLPLRRRAGTGAADIGAYLHELVRLVPDVIVVDGSSPDAFAEHARSFPAAVRHLAVDPDRLGDVNGKVAGVVTGLRRVRTPKAIVADDDVRYDAAALVRISRELDDADVVRPQNVFEPLPWHARLDTGRTLIARATGGDWPGTLGLRVAAFARVGGYAGDVLFENLELVRTLRAFGARERVALDFFVRRRPCDASHYASQRIRQAYDEFARPVHCGIELALAPFVAFAYWRFGWAALAAGATLAGCIAEVGRRRAGGTHAFPASTSVLAPVWVAERALAIWIALVLRVSGRGVRYAGRHIVRAATPQRLLRTRALGGAA